MIFILLVVIGILLAPIFTLGCVLIHFDYVMIGILAIIISFIRGNVIIRLRNNIYELQKEIQELKKKID